MHDEGQQKKKQLRRHLRRLLGSGMFFFLFITANLAYSNYCRCTTRDSKKKKTARFSFYLLLFLIANLFS